MDDEMIGRKKEKWVCVCVGSINKNWKGGVMAIEVVVWADG